MWPSRKTFVLERLRLREVWVIFFILGLMMMNYPFIDVFNKEKSIFGMPYLYLYFNVGWFASIGIIYLFTRASALSDRKNEKGTRH